MLASDHVTSFLSVPYQMLLAVALLAVVACLLVLWLLVSTRRRGLTAYVINRVGRPDRLARFRGAGHAGLQVRVVPGAEVEHGVGDLTRGEVGCFLSHAAAWRLILDGGEGAAVVAEDDADLRGVDLPALIACQLPSGWDVVFLGANWFASAVAVDASGCVVRPSPGVHGAHCYLVSRKGASRLLELAPSALAAGTAVDIFLSSPPLQYYLLAGSPVKPFDLSDSDTQGLA